MKLFRFVRVLLKNFRTLKRALGQASSLTKSSSYEIPNVNQERERMVLNRLNMISGASLFRLANLNDRKCRTLLVVVKSTTGFMAVRADL